MNNAIKYLSLAAAAVAVAGVASSCSREEDEIWEQSAAERLEQAQTDDYNILCSAPNGWEMLYFANGEERGYNFLMKFEQGDKVTIAARNANTSNAYQEETSAFDVIADDGPVLTFNTYNTLLHRYADPQPDHNTETDGVGSGGDYEFKIMSISEDSIYLRGKKRGVDIYMYRLDENIEWEQYFDDIYAMRDSMFNSSIPTLWLELADGVRYSITNASTQVMSMVPEGGDAITQTSVLPYVLTRRGFRWMYTFPGDTATTTPAREFVWNNEGTYLVSTGFSGDDDNCVAGATIKAPAIASLFMENSPVWKIDITSLGGEVATMYQNLVDGFASATNAGRPLNYILNGLSLLYDTSNDCAVLAISLRGTSAQGYVHYVRTANGDNGMKLDFNDSSLEDVFFTGSASQNGRTFLQLVPELTDFCDYISSIDFTMLPVGGNEVNPHRVRFENTSNTNDYFYVDLQ